MSQIIEDLEGMGQFIQVIDSHTEGEPTRILMGADFKILGKTILDKRSFFMTNLDHIRKLSLQEPRGHKDMFGAVVFGAKSGDYAMFFMDNNGYLDMCGHGTIGVSKLLHTTTGERDFTFETPAGQISSHISEDGSIYIENVNSYLVAKKLSFNTSKGVITGDIYYSGNHTLIIDTDESGLNLDKENLHQLIELAMEIKSSKSKLKIGLIKFSKKINRTHYKSLVVFGNRQVDRSPCGTGSSAKLAQLADSNQIKPGEEVQFESILGTKFKAWFNESTNKDSLKMIKPIILGNAFITGVNQLFLDSEDPLNEGFNL